MGRKSTILTALAAAKHRGVKLGLSSPDCRNLTAKARQRGSHAGGQAAKQAADEAYQELREFFAAMRPAFDRPAAERMLTNLPAPWALKDPRLCETFPLWWPLLRPYRPWLVWVDKDLDYVIGSYARRWKLPAELARRRYWACEQQFARYDGPKIRIEAERIAAAVALFDLSRTPAS